MHLSFLQEGKDGTDPDMDITKDPYDGKGSINDILQLGGLVVKDGCPPLVCESHCAGVDAPVFGLVSMGVPHKVLVRSEIDPAPALAKLLRHKGDH